MRCTFCVVLIQWGHHILKRYPNIRHIGKKHGIIFTKHTDRCTFYIMPHSENPSEEPNVARKRKSLLSIIIIGGQGSCSIMFSRKMQMNCRLQMAMLGKGRGNLFFVLLGIHDGTKQTNEFYYVAFVHFSVRHRMPQSILRPLVFSSYFGTLLLNIIIPFLQH